MRGLWARSAPALSAFTVLMLNSVVLVQTTGEHTVNIGGLPTRTEWFVLGMLTLVLPLAAMVGWLVSRIHSTRGRMVASTVAVALAALSTIPGGPSPRIGADLVIVAIAVAAVLLLTASGLGSIMAWSVRMTWRHLALAGGLMVRALPVVLLTLLVFFNTYAWLMASTVGRPRLWLAIGFLASVAVAFIASATVERLRPMLSATDQLRVDDSRLAGTPFEAMPDSPTDQRLSRWERVNVAFVLAASQIVQVAIVALITVLIFFVLGLILLSPPLLAVWTRGTGTSTGEFLTMTLPVPQALIQICMFMGAMTFMYISARAAGDADYRARFFDPLADDLRLTLAARHRYHAFTSR